MTTNLLDYDLEGLAAFCERLGEKRFRATQLFRWIHQRGASSFDQMTDLAKSLREKLPASARIEGMTLVSRHDSVDGTIKWLFSVGAGDVIETVFIPESDRGCPRRPCDAGRGGFPSWPRQCAVRELLSDKGVRVVRVA